MSTDFRPLTTIRMSDLFDGRLAKLQVNEHIHPSETSEQFRCLSDGMNYVWVHADGNGCVGGICRYGLNNPSYILGVIENEFNTVIVSEHEPQFWGFDSQEEWDEAHKTTQQKADDAFHAELMKFVSGESCGIEPGTVGMLEAAIAKQLVS